MDESVYTYCVEQMRNDIVFRNYLNYYFERICIPELQRDSCTYIETSLVMTDVNGHTYLRFQNISKFENKRVDTVRYDDGFSLHSHTKLGGFIHQDGSLRFEFKVRKASQAQTKIK